MNFACKTTMPLAAVVAVSIQIVALAWYWIVEPFIMIIWFVPLVSIVIIAIIWSLIAIIACRGVKRVLPLALVTASLALAYGVPYTKFSVHIDFKSKQKTMTEISLTAQRGDLSYKIVHSYGLESGGLFTEYELPKENRGLVKYERIYTSDVECGKYVFFPTFYGIPDGTGGFLYVPECVKPEQFPGGRFGAKWFGVRSIEDRWYRIDGT